MKAEINNYVDNSIKEKDSIIDEIMAREISEVRGKYLEIAELQAELATRK